MSSLRRAAFLVLLAACSPPLHVVLKIEDPEHLADAATALFCGAAGSEPRRVQLNRALTFPLQITVSAPSRDQEIVVEAREHDVAVARGKVHANLARKGTPTTNVSLLAVCESGFPDGVPCFHEGSEPAVCVAGQCVIAGCGDGYVDSDAREECDDGNSSNTDGCVSTVDDECILAGCGDGFVYEGVEACDDANTAGGDGCAADCSKLEVCGDGVLDAGETCDDGSSNGGGPGLCVLGCGGRQTCGDGITNGTESCDDANNDEWSFLPHCNSTCAGLAPHCGDGTEDGYEECDDGNDGDDCNGCLDGCRRACTCQPDSCPPGGRCIEGVCAPCEDELNCGPECAPCDAGGDTPVCGGMEVGCIVDPTTGCTDKPDFTLCQVITEPDRSYDICSSEQCISPGVAFYPDGIERWGPCAQGAGNYVWSCNPPNRLHLTDTGQRTCYTRSGELECTCFPCDDAACGNPEFCGQDAQYGWDQQNPSTARFERSPPPEEEPVVTDTITGLMWQGCAGPRGSDCTVGGAAAFTWEGALSFCDGLVWGGYADWRLPDYWELQTILDASSNGPAIDGVAFPETLSIWYWSSSVSFLDTTYATVVNFLHGDVRSVVANQIQPGRCVRGRVTPSSVPRFVRSEPLSGEPIVTDTIANLVWQGCVGGLTGTDCDGGTVAPQAWREALAYCEALTWAGASDWRLPSRNELVSIVDLNQGIDRTLFPLGPADTTQWTSTTSMNSSSNGWAVSFYDGDVSELNKFSSYRVRCVRSSP